MPPLLYLLALAAFAAGTSEFMLSGLVPDIAADLGVPLGVAGLLTSGFAAGMVVGAPLVAALARRWPPRRSLLAALGLFVIAHVVGALTESFALLLATRAIAALANAGLLAVALAVAVRAVPPERTARALSVLLSGTTVAMVAGVPAGALLGDLLGWRSTFWAVAGLCVLAGTGLARALPAAGGDGAYRPPAGLSREIAELRRPRLLVVLGLAAVVNAAMFGSLTYLSPVVTDATGLSRPWVPVTLALLGLGAFLGLTVTGRLGDRHGATILRVGMPLLALTWLVVAVSAARPAVLLVGVPLLGAVSFAVGATLVVRVLGEAPAAPTMAGSYATAAINVGATLGPVLAGAALTTTLDARGPLWTSAILATAGLVIACMERKVARPAVRGLGRGPRA